MAFGPLPTPPCSGVHGGLGYQTLTRFVGFLPCSMMASSSDEPAKSRSSSAIDAPLHGPAAGGSKSPGAVGICRKRCRTKLGDPADVAPRPTVSVSVQPGDPAGPPHPLQIQAERRQNQSCAGGAIAQAAQHDCCFSGLGEGNALIDAFAVPTPWTRPSGTQARVSTPHPQVGSVFLFSFLFVVLFGSGRSRQRSGHFASCVARA